MKRYRLYLEIRRELNKKMILEEAITSKDIKEEVWMNKARKREKNIDAALRLKQLIKNCVIMSSKHYQASKHPKTLTMNTTDEELILIL